MNVLWDKAKKYYAHFMLPFWKNAPHFIEKKKIENLALQNLGPLEWYRMASAIMC